MSIWNKVFVGLIVFVSLFFFYFAARTLRTHQYWRTSVEKHNKRIAELQDEVQRLRYGTKDDQTRPGLLEMQAAVYKALVGRGRVWYNCTPLQMVKPEAGDAQSGDVLVKTDLPKPHGIADKTILAVFDEKNVKDGGGYLGQFIVKGVDEQNQQIGITPCRKLRPEELKRLAQSRGPWTLCEVMPADDHEIFAGMSPQELERILPGEVLDEYVNDGKDGHRRQLRDYQYLFDTLNQQLCMLTDLSNTAALNKRLVEAALAEAKRQVQLRQAEIRELAEQLDRMQRQRDIVAAHEKSLRTEIAARKKSIAALLSENRALAAEIARDQLEAVRRIDAVTATSD